MKVPAILATGLICFILGVGLGMLGMANLDLVVRPPASTNTAPPGGPAGMGAMPMPGMMPMPGGGGGGRGPSPRTQLVNLVAKINDLTQQPLSVTLTAEDKAKLAEQLKGLAELDALDDEEAKKRLDAILVIVKDDKAALEAAGYRWPGDDTIRPRGGAPNPFREVDNGAHLKALEERLAKAKDN